MALRGPRMARVSGWAGAAVLAACVALTVTAPSSAASEARASAGPSGVQARAAAIAVASTGRVLWSRDLNTELPIASITKVMTALVVIREQVNRGGATATGERRARAPVR
jgi:serine-type D-Ala-D-Ala carboxypeptidase (penicillin-binding protein 5/6)